MGEKLEEYTDNTGNTVRDNDIVVYDGREYRVAYISHLYVNLDGGRGNWRHLPFHVGVPERKISNAPKAFPPSPVRTVTRHEIVPGVYGHIWVDSVDEDWIAIGMRNNALKNLDAVGMSFGEFNDMVNTLQTIRDAMKANTTA